MSRGRTQAQTAEQAGISEEYFSKIERGLSSPSFAVIGKIAECLGVEPMELFRFSPLLDEMGMRRPDVMMVSSETKDANSSGWGVFVSTRGGRFHFVSPELSRLFKYESSSELVESIRDIASELYSDPGQRVRVLNDLPGNGEMRSFDATFTCKDGERLNARLHICRLEPSALPDGEHLLTGIVETEGRMGSDNHEGDRRELHHRLKNQLGLLASYVYLRARRVRDTECAELLREVELKIHSLAHVHEHLHRTGLRVEMDASVYLQSLAANLAEALAGEAKVEFDVRASSLRMSWDMVSQLGMMLAELLTNAVKHAYPDEQGGVVRVDLSLKDDTCRLVVHDDGPGFPGEPCASEMGYGLRLVRSLAEQLGGNMGCGNDNGAVVRIEFPFTRAPLGPS